MLPAWERERRPLRVDGRPSHLSPRKLMYQLWVDRSFFIRCPDRMSLKSALETVAAASR